MANFDIIVYGLNGFMDSSCLKWQNDGDSAFRLQWLHQDNYKYQCQGVSIYVNTFYGLDLSLSLSLFVCVCIARSSVGDRGSEGERASEMSRQLQMNQTCIDINMIYRRWCAHQHTDLIWDTFILNNMKSIRIRILADVCIRNGKQS